MDLELRLQSGLFHPLKLNQERLNLMNNLLVTCSPGQNVSNYETKTKDLTQRLSRAFQSFMNQKYEAVVQLQSIIEHLNPDAILEKGYSITYSIPARNIVKNTSQVSYDDRLEIVLAKGKLNAKVIK